MQPTEPGVRDLIDDRVMMTMITDDNHVRDGMLDILVMIKQAMPRQR